MQVVIYGISTCKFYLQLVESGSSVGQDSFFEVYAKVMPVLRFSVHQSETGLRKELLLIPTSLAHNPST